jgi:hypothetical protein
MSIPSAPRVRYDRPLSPPRAGQLQGQPSLLSIRHFGLVPSLGEGEVSNLPYVVLRS